MKIKYLRPSITFFTFPWVFPNLGFAVSNYRIYKCQPASSNQHLPTLIFVKKTDNFPSNVHHLYAGKNTLKTQKTNLNQPTGFISKRSEASSNFTCHLTGKHAKNGNNVGVCNISCPQLDGLIFPPANLKFSRSIHFYQTLAKLNKNIDKTTLINITFKLINSELLKYGKLPIDDKTGKLLSKSLSKEQLEILQQHQPLMREAIRQYSENIKNDKRNIHAGK